MSIGKKLKLIREKLNISQDELAKSLGISARMLREYEKDKFLLDVGKIQILIEKYNLNPNYLFFDIEEMLLQETVSPDYIKTIKEKLNINNDELTPIIQELIASKDMRTALLNLIKKKKQNKAVIKDLGDILELLLN